jgi:FtsZ-interacting cell division protein ZipA
MFFKNKLTGLTWEIIDSDHIKRCQKDSNYEEVKVQPKKEEPKKESEKDKPKQTKQSSKITKKKVK